MTTQEQIDFFFADHRIVPISGNVSTLVLLRRDLDTCFGIDPNTGNTLQYVDPNTGVTRDYPKVIWPGVMIIMAGIDLLAKFYEVSDTTTGSGIVGRRFKGILRGCGMLQGTNPDVIWKLRNALLHSFSVYTEGNYVFKLHANRLPNLINRQQGHLTNTQSSNQSVILSNSTLINNINAGVASTTSASGMVTPVRAYGGQPIRVIDIGVPNLVDLLNTVINNYQTKIGQDVNLRSNFENMFDNYGTVIMSHQ